VENTQNIELRIVSSKQFKHKAQSLGVVLWSLMLLACAMFHHLLQYDAIETPNVAALLVQIPLISAGFPPSLRQNSPLNMPSFSHQNAMTPCQSGWNSARTPAP